MKKVALLLVFAALVSCGSLRVSSDYDLKVDFSTYDSYAFFKPGIDKVEISDLDKRRILNALETALQSKGFEASEKPDLLISFKTQAKENVNVHHNYPYYGWGWGWHPFGIYHQPYVSTQTQGILYIDLIDAKTKHLVWQGKGVGVLQEGTVAKREARIGEFVQEIINQYPPGSN